MSVAPCQSSAPLVSVVTTTYNHAPYIRQCLDSILGQQTAFPFEVLVHDDASTDGTTEILREYAALHPDTIVALFQQTNQHTLRRKIIRDFIRPRVRGRYIAYCEGDDYWIDVHKLQKQVDVLEENPEVGLVHTEAACEDEINGRRVDCLHASRGIVNDHVAHIDRQLLLGQYAVHTATAMMRTELWQRIAKEHPFEYSEHFRMGDIQTWYFIARESKIRYINETTAVYRMHGASVTARAEPRRELPFAWNCLKMYLRLADAYGQPLDVRKSVRMRIGRWIIRLIVRSRKWRAIGQLFRALFKWDAPWVVRVQVVAYVFSAPADWAMRSARRRAVRLFNRR